jgi:alkaline phosphatase
MTEKALEILTKSPRNRQGFVALVEAARVDMSEHSNDAATLANELAELERTFQVLERFVEHHNGPEEETSLILTADHETGGLSLGKGDYSQPLQYPEYAWYPQVLHQVNCSGEWMAAHIQYWISLYYLMIFRSDDDISRVFEECTGYTLTGAQLSQAMEARASQDAPYLIRSLSASVASRSNIGWTTWGHSGGDVALYALGKMADRGLLQRNMDNTDIPHIVAKELGLNYVGSVIQLPPQKRNSVYSRTFDEFHPKLHV